MGPVSKAEAAAERIIERAVRGHFKVVDLGGLGLTFVPESLRSVDLRRLNLARNQLESLPSWIGDFEFLEHLGLQGNRLKSLPSELRKLSTLELLFLNDNPDLALPPEIVATLNPAIILDFYFRTRGKRGGPLNEAKLVLVGRGEVGKTSIVQRLLGLGFDPDSSKTEGIQISNWRVGIGPGDKVLLRMWDFGGQEIMHATHQFFLTERSLYVLVLNGREGGEDSDVEYWLKLIESFGGDSPVIVVLNKIRSHPFDLNRAGLEHKYPDRIKAFVRTDCKTSTGIPELRNTILREVEQLPYLRTNFSESWFRVKQRLSEMKENFVTFDQYRELCRQCGESDAESQANLATILHCLGIALNYKDDTRLRDTHVLNPRWVTNGIYKILNSLIVEQQNGEVSLGDLRNILDAEQYPSRMHEFLLNLMRRFELCFRFPDPRDDVFLIPQLLGKEQPPEAAAFDRTDCLRFQFAYTVWPEGALPRFIVRTHALSARHPRWRTGVILEFEGNRALIQAEPHDKVVNVAINGPASSRRRLLAVIRSDFDRIHSDFPKLQAESKAPLPGAPEHALSYDDLLVFERNNRSHMDLVVAGKVVSVSVSAMLNSIDLPSQERTYDTPKVFISYSHKDEDLRAELDAHLKIFHRQGLIQSWHDRRISAGDDWRSEIDQHLSNADLILLLVSADFVASDYCYDQEMVRAMQRYERSKARVVPVLVRECLWRRAPFGKLQPLPANGRPIRSWPDRDAAWSDVARGLEAAITQMHPQR